MGDVVLLFFAYKTVSYYTKTALACVYADHAHYRFWLSDPFVGIMKGVISRINPEAQVIDLTHGVPAQDVMAGALTLRHSVRYFGDGAIHVVVVDPGVGGAGGRC